MNLKGMKVMNQVKNKLTVSGSIKDLISFIKDNYERDIYHPSDGKYPPNYILFFGNLFPTPEDIIDDKNKIYRWRMNNWGTPFLASEENQINELHVLYKHDYDYTVYSITSEEGMFNPYVIRKLSEYSEMFYGENIHPDENELVSLFNTTITPPSKIISKWIDVYKYTSLVFRLDYWDEKDRFVGNIHYDYNTKTYILEHHVRDHNLTEYVRYTLEEDVKTIDSYACEITQMLIEIKKDKMEYNYNELRDMLIEEIEEKHSFEEQVKFISDIIRYLNGKKCNS
jgi:hypothetical protein